MIWVKVAWTSRFCYPEVQWWHVGWQKLNHPHRESRNHGTDIAPWRHALSNTADGAWGHGHDSYKRHLQRSSSITNASKQFFSPYADSDHAQQTVGIQTSDLESFCDVPAGVVVVFDEGLLSNDCSHMPPVVGIHTCVLSLSQSFWEIFWRFSAICFSFLVACLDARKWARVGLTRAWCDGLIHTYIHAYTANVHMHACTHSCVYTCDL